jgi:hypothetical protein
MSPLFQDTDWVDDIRKTMSLLKKNSASLKRQSSQFEPMRKPDILKLRRESLSKIMLSRKTEESRRQLLKGTVSRELITLPEVWIWMKNLPVLETLVRI